MENLEKRTEGLDVANQIVKKSIWLDHTSATLWEALGLSRAENEVVLHYIVQMFQCAYYPSQLVERLLTSDVLSFSQKLMGLIYIGMLLARPPGRG